MPTLSNNPTANSALMLSSGQYMGNTGAQFSALNSSAAKSMLAKTEQKSKFLPDFLDREVFGFSVKTILITLAVGLVVWKWVLPMIGLRKKGASSGRRLQLARARAAKARRRKV